MVTARLLLLAIVPLTVPVMGCLSGERMSSEKPIGEGPIVQGVVFLVGGVGGIDPLYCSGRCMLPHAGVPHELRDFRWTNGVGRILRDLQDIRHVNAVADELAAEVRAIKEADPNRPVYLVGHSGGAGVCLAAAERLPPGTLERIILLSAAVSPTLDLRPALRATRGEIVSFYSAMDVFVLGWGTSTFGTIDRVYTSSAGRTGFDVPCELDAEGRALYARLVQIPWRIENLCQLDVGGHHSSVMPCFLADHVAQWLKP
jgi:pimeloyl-ACP methyl ester carboxylesterase